MNNLEINRDISKLHPKLADALKKLLRQAKENSLLVAFFEGYRHPERQDYLYGVGRFSGRGEPGKTVTDAGAYESWHNYSLAFDLCFLTSKNRFIWPAEPSQWRILGELGEALGLDWGGKWPKPDFPHFQLTGNFPDVGAAKKVLDSAGIAEVWRRV